MKNKWCRSPRGYSTSLSIPWDNFWGAAAFSWQIVEGAGDWGIQNTSQLFSFWNIYNTCLSFILFLLFGGVQAGLPDRSTFSISSTIYFFPKYIHTSLYNRYYRVLFCCTVVVFYSILGILNFIVFIACLLACKTSLKNSENVFGRCNAVAEHWIWRRDLVAVTDFLYGESKRRQRVGRILSKKS